MKLKLQEVLFRRYPKILRKSGSSLDDPNRGLGSGNDLVAIALPFDKWGVQCDDGWFFLVENLCNACEREIETLISQGITKQCWPRISQIKEKLGGMRFYTTGPLSDGLRAHIQRIVNQSFYVCERCGAPIATPTTPNNTCPVCLREP